MSQERIRQLLVLRGSFTYNPAGAVTSMQLGNGRWESTVFNSRLQPTQIALGTTPGTTDKLKLDYGYGTTANNGNVLSQTITVKRSGQSDLVFDQTYTYDELNRILVAEEKTGTTTNWKQVFTFDRYGNRRFDEGNTTTLPKNCGTSPNFVVCTPDIPKYNPTVSASTNKLNGYTFDDAGNVITDADGRSFTYDAENKQVEVKDSGSSTIGTYYFDGDGKRVKKVVPSTGETTIFVYDASAKLVAEYSTIVQPAQDAKVQYLTNDHLGTPRINTDANGAVVSRSDYMPYGEEIIGLGGRSSNEKYVTDDVRPGFTGYINDGESELGYANARMYAKNIGRFTGVDPYGGSGFISVPQSWNRYSYCLNRPNVFRDPTGLMWLTADDKNFVWVEDSEYEKNKEKYSGYRVANGAVVQLGSVSDGLSQYKKLVGRYVTLNDNHTLSEVADPTVVVSGGGDLLSLIDDSHDDRISNILLGTVRSEARGQPPWSNKDFPDNKGGGTTRYFGKNGEAMFDIDRGHDYEGEGDPHIHWWD